MNNAQATISGRRMRSGIWVCGFGISPSWVAIASLAGIVGGGQRAKVRWRREQLSVGASRNDQRILDGRFAGNFSSRRSGPQRRLSRWLAVEIDGDVEAEAEAVRSFGKRQEVGRLEQAHPAFHDEDGERSFAQTGRAAIKLAADIPVVAPDAAGVDENRSDLDGVFDTQVGLEFLAIGNADAVTGGKDDARAGAVVFAGDRLSVNDQQPTRRQLAAA